MKIEGRSEPVVGEMAWEDLWLEVICLSNPEIAGSPRNIFRYSPLLKFCGVELLDGLPSISKANQLNSEYANFFPEESVEPG